MRDGWKDVWPGDDHHHPSDKWLYVGERPRLIDAYADDCQRRAKWGFLCQLQEESGCAVAPPWDRHISERASRDCFIIAHGPIYVGMVSVDSDRALTVVILKKYRRHGYAAMAVESICVSRAGLTARVADDNASAIGLLVSAGFWLRGRGGGYSEYSQGWREVPCNV